MPSARTTAQPSGRKQAPQHPNEFARLAEPYRREIKLHCYRMLGSLFEAEDLVQETYLRAWRGFDGFAGGSFRAWPSRTPPNCLSGVGADPKGRAASVA